MSDAVEAYFNQWINLINDLQKIYESNELIKGKEAAIQLSLCYIEALGKLFFFQPECCSFGPAKIFCNTLKLFKISKTDANKIYNYRSEIVHAGPFLKNFKIKQNGESRDLDIKW